MAIPNQTGSGFTNIQNFLGANQNNGLGSAIQNGVQGQVNNFNSGLQAGQSQFNSDIDAAKSSINLGDTGAKSAINDASNLQGGQDLSNQDQTDYNNFTGSSYNGPTALNNDSQLQSQAGQISNTADQTKTDSGRQGLLQQYAGQGQYTQGQQSVDNLLLNNTGKQALQQTRAIANPVAGTLNNAESDATNQGAQTANYLTGLQQADQGAVTQGYTTRGDAAQANYNQLNSTVPTQFNNYLAALNGNTGVTQTGATSDPTAGYSNDLQLNQNLGNILGLTSGENIYDTTGQQLATQLQGPQNLTLAGTTNADQYAQYEALSKLGNNANNIYNGSDPSTVGTYQGISANQAGVQNLVDQAGATYQNQLNTPNVINSAATNGYGLAAGTGPFSSQNIPYGGQMSANQAITDLPYVEAANTHYNGFLTPQLQALQNGLKNYQGSIGQTRGVSFTDDPNQLVSELDNSAPTFNGIRGRIS